MVKLEKEAQARLWRDQYLTTRAQGFEEWKNTEKLDQIWVFKRWLRLPHRELKRTGWRENRVNAAENCNTPILWWYLRPGPGSPAGSRYISQIKCQDSMLTSVEVVTGKRGRIFKSQTVPQNLWSLPQLEAFYEHLLQILIINTQNVICNLENSCLTGRPIQTSGFQNKSILSPWNFNPSGDCVTFPWNIETFTFCIPLSSLSKKYYRDFF